MYPTDGLKGQKPPAQGNARVKVIKVYGRNVNVGEIFPAHRAKSETADKTF